MSTPFYDLASLVVVPSGYKASKVYAQKPLTTDGQLSFTRSTGASRVASNGLIEKVRTNLFFPSGMTSNISLDGLTRTAGQADPFGGTTAVKFAASATTGTHRWYNLSMPPTSAVHTISIYVKADGVNTFALYGQGGTVYVIWDLSTQTVLQANGNPLRSLVSVGNGWYRASMTFGGGSWCGFYLTSGTTTSWTGNGTDGMFATGFQVEDTDFGPTPYIATTTAAVSVGPVANVPRLDYLGSTCGPRILLEPQRTNSVLWSEQLDNAYWTKTNVSVSANSIASPDGYTNADKVTETASTGIHVVQSTFVANQIGTISVFAKAGERRYVTISKTSGSTNFGTATFDLLTGTLTQENKSATAVPKIENYGNGWYRLSVYFSVAASGFIWFGLSDSATYGTASTAGFKSYAGDGTSGAYFWGAQFEGSDATYSTSYIPTLGAAVTRGADDCVKSSATSIIGQTEGVVYFEWEYQNVGSSGGSIPISLDRAAGGDEIYFWVKTDGSYTFDVAASGAGQVGITGSMGSFGTKKIALAYKNNDFALYINGVLAGTDTSGTVPTCNRLYVGRYWANSNYNISSGIKQALLFKTRLTNAQLAELTTL